MSLPPHRFRVPAALILALPVLAQAPEGDLAERLFRSGERAYSAKSHKEAIDTWGQLLQSSPRSEFAPMVLLRLARHELEVERRPAAALPHLDRLRNEYIKSPEAAEGLLLRGQLLALQARRPGELKDAMAEFNRILDLFPASPACAAARLELGRAWRDQGQWARALQSFTDAFRLHAGSAAAPAAMLEAAESLDRLGDLPGCLRLLQRVAQGEASQGPLAAEAAWRLAVRVRHRLQKPPLRNEGPWPAGRTKWLKTPTLLATGAQGDLFLFQNDLDRAFRLQGGEPVPAGGPAAGTRVLIPTPAGGLWMASKGALVKDEGGTLPLGTLTSVSGAALDRWGTLWVADSRTPALTLFPAEGAPRTVACPTVHALVALGGGGFVAAADGDRKLLFLDGEGQPRFMVPYGKDLPAPFRTVTALASDGAGHVAALVDGGDWGEGVVVFGPDGAVLRFATLKALGITGRITSLALDRSGGILLCDRRNDLLIRLS